MAEGRHPIRSQPDTKLRRKLGGLALRQVLLYVGSGVVIYSVVGEFEALLALYRQNARGQGGYVLSALLVLLAVAAIGPIYTYAKVTSQSPSTATDRQEPSAETRPPVS